MNWHLDQVFWVEQWFIIEPKLTILKNLVCEQLKLGHIELSARRHNTLTFNTKKMYGQSQLLQDLRATNDQMKKWD